MKQAFSSSGAPLGAPRNLLVPFGGLTRFPLYFQSILRRLEGLKRLKPHCERLPPHRLLAGAKGGAQGGADRYPRIQGGAHPPVPPCSKDSGPHEKVDRKVQISNLDLDNLLECFRMLTQLLLKKITWIGIRCVYFNIFSSVVLTLPYCIVLQHGIRL